MIRDHTGTDARDGLRGPPAVSFLQAVSNFDGCRCCCRARSAPATKRKIYRMHKRLSPQRDTGKCLEMLRLKTKVNQSMKC